MPRGGPPTYTYTLPPVYLAVPGTTILATQHNTPLEDIEDTFNTEWPGYLVQWVVPTADVLELPDGAEGAPSLTFTNDADTGLWRPSSGIVSISTNGVTTASFASTGFTGGTTDTAQYAVSRNGNTGSVLLRGASNSGAGEIELFGSSHATKARDIEFHSNGTTIYSYDFSAQTHSFINSVSISGLLDISGAAAGQIKFPATQNPSSNANTLDDYEEGTWTPTLTFGGGSTGITYSARTGIYTKIGAMVWAGFNITLSAKGSSTGTALVSGLPFNAAGLTSVAASVGSYGSFSGLTGAIISDVSSGDFRVFQSAATSTTALTDAVFTANTVLRNAASYQV